MPSSPAMPKRLNMGQNKGAQGGQAAVGRPKNRDLTMRDLRDPVDIEISKLLNRPGLYTSSASDAQHLMELLAKYDYFVYLDRDVAGRYTAYAHSNGARIYRDSQTHYATEEAAKAGAFLAMVQRAKAFNKLMACVRKWESRDPDK